MPKPKKSPKKSKPPIRPAQGKLSKAALKATTKKGSAATKLSKKQVAATAKMIRESFNAKQQRAIERLLGEEFDSLAQAKRELRRNTVQIKRTTKATIKEAKSLAKVFRDAFGRFSPASAKTPQKPSQKTRSTKSPGTKPPKRGTPAKQPKSRQSKPSVLPPTQKPTPPKPPPSSKKSAVTFRKLRPRKGETLLQLLDRLEAMGNEADKLLKPGEYWIFTYAKGRSKRAYGSLALAVRKMREYKLSQAILGGRYDDLETEDDLVTSIGFGKISGGRPQDYEQTRHDENEDRKAERRKTLREADKLLKKHGVVVNKFGGAVARTEAILKLASEGKLRNRKFKLGEII